MDKQDQQHQLTMLAEQTLSGDMGAYNRLLSIVTPALNQYFRRQFNLGLTAEDLTQETLLAVHTKFHTFKRGQPFMPWLYAVARYKAIDYLRRMKRLMPINGTIDEQDISQIPAPTQTTEPPEDVLAAALSQLSQRDRTLIQLAKLDGMPLQQVSQTLGISLAATKTGLHRAVRRLTGKEV